MNLKYFFLLYLRNAKSTFLNGFMSADTNYALAPVSWLAHLFLLPITLTIGSGIKTLIDFFTRKSMPKEDISTRKTEVNDMTSNEIDELVEKMSKYTAQSDSSRLVLEKLQQLSFIETSKLTSAHVSKKFKLAEDQLGNVRNKYTEEYTASLVLDETHEVALTEYDELNKQYLAQQKLQRQKEIIGGYMNAEKNNGKKLLQIIMGMFTVPEVETPRRKKTPEVNTDVDTTLSVLPI